MAELLLDSDIRLWVFLPIVVITFLVGIIRHYVTILLSTEKKVELQQISDRYLSAYRHSLKPLTNRKETIATSGHVKACS